MKNPFIRNLNKYRSRKDNEGSFTIEASLVFPMILLLIVAFILISIYIYQKVTLYYIASQAAERAAFVWDNSSRDLLTGEYLNLNTEVAYDGLYWRLTDDRILDLLLSNFADYRSSEVLIGSGIQTEETDEDLPLKKMQRVAKIIPEGISGTISYHNNLAERKITVELESPLKIPSFVGNLIGDKIKAKASATITDPVEFTRNIDFVRIYGQWLLKNRDKVKGILKKAK